MIRRGVVHVDKDLCKGCMLCVKMCPVNALAPSDEVNRFGWRLPHLVGNCIACRLCEKLCPDMALWVEVIEDEAS